MAMRNQRGLVDGSMLSYLSDSERTHLLDAGVRRSYAAREIVLREGDPANFVQFLVSGWVRVSISLSDGGEILLALRGPGDVLGDLAALLERSRTASVHTIEPVVVVQLTREQFLARLESHRNVALAMIKTLAVRLHEAEKDRVDNAPLDVSRRVAMYLVRMATEHGIQRPRGIEIDIPLTQRDIANSVNASKRTVARAFAVLRERGVVVTGRQQIMVRRIDVLRALAQ